MSESTTVGASDSETVSAVTIDDEILPGEGTDEVRPEPRMNIVIRQVLERQLTAGQALSSQLLNAATDVTTAVAHAPATFAAAIQEGDTISSAWTRTGADLHGVADEAGGRARAAVVSYIGHQATLPVAVLGCVGEIAGSLAAAQGTVVGSALDGAFAVAVAATNGENMRQVVGRNIGDVRATAAAARGDLDDSVTRAGLEVRQAVGGDLEPLVAAITGADEDC
ncbi:hypothetical protein BayCH28_11145 [Mycolicibacterium sp. CH28]|uniref:hypothetical protein n=1 Tax=Mycolicibacterium sp. CH28 TaxID=2512237 RepID=UPI001080A747|nr:hypothetical protein [Mycolicibacterium sp. CH28]TGD88305.1 hypothetical protein BayCH28_11145 [Mycolicibacterium sp. CH28]